jgi:hypothetical protein
VIRTYHRELFNIDLQVMMVMIMYFQVEKGGDMYGTGYLKMIRGDFNFL